MNHSILCNLRGFLLNDGFALDYSDVHELNEGLCYMFRCSPTLYFPYLSVKDAFVHLEPYKVKLTYFFSQGEL